MRRAVIIRLALGAAALAAVGTAASRAQDAPGGISAVEVSAEGKQVYEEICQSCHMADARGGAGAGAVGGAILTGGSAVGTIGGAAVGGVIGHEVGKDDKK